jgi:CubicO group peptidase (beta-lactamase class C family)
MPVFLLVCHHRFRQWQRTTWPTAIDPSSPSVGMTTDTTLRSALADQATGERLDRTADSVIWKPLGMSDTRLLPSMCQDTDAALEPEAALGPEAVAIGSVPTEPRACAHGEPPCPE